MKKIVFILTCVALLVVGQAAKAQIVYSVGVGAGTHGYSLQTAGTSEGHAAIQLSLEADATCRFSGQLAASAGLSLTGVAGPHFGGSKKNLGEIYLDIPLRAKYYFPLSENLDLYLFAGPVLSLNLISLDAHSNASASNFKTYPNLSRVDLMLGGGAGLDIMEDYRITLGYDYGLLDRDKSADVTIHTGGLRLTVAYLF